MPEPPPDSRRPLLAAAVIAALGLAGSIGAARSTRGICPLPDGDARRNVIAPIGLEPATLRFAPLDPAGERSSAISR